MSVVANVAVNLDTKDAVRNARSLDDAIGGLSGKSSKLQQAFGGLNTALAGLGLSALAKEIGGAGIEADRTSKRIKNLGDANNETAKIFDLAKNAAKDFGLSQQSAQSSVADLYGRLRPTGVALKDIETVFYGVNKAALAAGLGAADTDAVLLQLSQSLGSGAFQGDELRSVMERMPAVGQAVAKVMGVTVGAVKQLGADGKITTDVMIKAAAELNKLKPPPADAFRLFEAAMGDLRTELGENLLPLIVPLVQGLTKVLNVFGSLPEPIQTVLVAFLGISAAIIGIGAAVAFLAPVLAGLNTFFLAIGAANVGGLIAGWLPVFAGILSWIGSTFIPALLAFFSGPVGWTILAVAAVVAMVVAFREPIAKFLVWLSGIVGQIAMVFWEATKPLRETFVQAFEVIKGVVGAFFDFLKGIFTFAFLALYAIAYQLFARPFIALWENILRAPVTAAISWFQKAFAQIANFFNVNVIQPITAAWKTLSGYLRNVFIQIAGFFKTYVVDPISSAWKTVTEFIPKALQRAADFVKGIWTGIVNAIKGAIRMALQYIANNINSVIRLVNNLISGFNRLPGPDIPMISQVSVPAFAEGGVVRKPTLAMVGEGGQPEFIVPESKATTFSQNWLDSVDSGANAGGGASPQINITTGPVVEFDGQKYVSIGDLEQAMRITAESVMQRLRTPAARIAMGVG